LLLDIFIYIFAILIPNLKILQLEEYLYFKLIKYNFKANRLYIVFYLFPLVFFWCVFLNNGIVKNIILSSYLTLFFIFYFLLMLKTILKEVFPKFTKRIFRIIIMFILLSITCIILSQYYNIITLYTILMPYVLLFLTIISNLIICLIELVLSCFYAFLASKKLKKHNLIKIGITGSYGKTSVKNILHTILSEKYSVLTTPKSYNTINGLSMTIKNNNLSKHDVFIMEMGAKKKGEIKSLCKYFKPQYGILTSIGKQHLESFKSIDNIIKTKSELQKNLSEDSFMVFNCDNEYVNNLYLNYGKKKLSVGVINGECVDDCTYGLFAVIKKLSSCGSVFDIYYKGKFKCNVSTDLCGEHNILNIILAVGIAIKLGLDTNQIVNGILKLKPVESRMQPIELDSGAIIINNGYNSNPSSAEASLKLLKLYSDKCKIVITPGFVEMGKEQFDLNYNFGKLISLIADECYVVNKVNRDAIVKGLKDSNFNKSIVIVDKFKQINFNNFTANDVILIENDLPDNYV